MGVLQETAESAWFIWGPWTSEQNFMAIHLIFVEIFQSGPKFWTDWLTVTAIILRVLNGRIWSLYPNDRATSHLTRILEEHVCVILCTMLEADCSRAVCVFQFCSSFLPYSLHVWDTVLPDCLGMGVRRITCVCSQSVYLLKNRLLLL